MQKSKVFLLSFIFIAFGISAYSQYNMTIGQVSIASPNAASLGKYGDIPVSYHTGIPEIDIPIYTIQNGPVAMPISLSYHASGLKVQEEASWVGAGWSLNAGGVISRTVVGGPDDRGLNSAYTNKGHFSDYGYNSYLFGVGPVGCPSASGLETCPVGRAGMPASSYPPQDGNIMSGIFDGEPDLYFFNFNGHVGKFYFNDDRTPIIEPEQDMQITPIYTGTDWRGMTGFIITTSDGVQYYFGVNTLSDGNPDALDITYDVTTEMSYNGQGAVSAWYLNKIVSADGQFADTLIYQTESYSYYTYSMFPIPEVENPSWFAYNHDYDLCKNFINGVRLAKIKFPQGEVDFTPGALRQDLSLGTGPFPNYTYTGLSDQPNSDAVNGARTLGSVTIKSNALCKKESFYYHYFYDNTPLTGQLLTASYPQFQPTCDEYRLCLDSVQEISCDASLQVPSYKFSYYSGTVPRKLSMGIDHWGFYNGASNSDLIPTFTIVPPSSLPGDVNTYPGADRDTHWPYSEGGALEQITYPTGGYTQFTYESNDVYTAMTVYTPKQVVNVTAGYGNQTGAGQPFTTTSDTYELQMSSNQPSTQTGGTLELLNNGTEAYAYSVPAGQTSQPTYFTLPSGTTYTPEMIDNNNNGALGNYGVFATLTDLVPTIVNANTSVGGLRIKTITHNDGMTATNQVTNFGYTFSNVAGGQSSGILFSVPTYVQEIRNDAWAQVNGNSCSGLGCAVCLGGMSYYKSPSSIRPMAESNGNHIGYGEVYVSQTGNGYTKYQYYSSNGTLVGPWQAPLTDVCVRSIADICEASIPNSPAPPVPFDPQRGELAYQYDYNSSGNLVKSVNSIPSYQFDSLITPGLISKFFVTAYVTSTSTIGDDLQADPNYAPSGGWTAVGLSTFTEYNLQSAKKVSDSIITNIYDPLTGNSTTDTKTTYYGSRYHHAPTQLSTYSSSGQRLVSNFSNAFDFRISNFNVADQLPTYYTNIYTDNTWLTNAFNGITLSPTDPNYYWDRINAFTDWRYMKAIDRQTYSTWRQQTYSGSGSTYATDHNSAEVAADGELLPVLTLQDHYQNPVIEKSTWNSGRLIHSEYTHHGFATNPSTGVYPYTTQLINLQAPSASFSPAAVSGNTISRDSRYLPEANYTWSLGNVQQVTNHDSLPNYYIWDYGNTEPIAKVLNASAGQAAYTSFEADGGGGWTIPSISRDTGSITGTSCYNLNNGAPGFSGLSTSGSYVVSYWSKSGSYAVNGQTSLLQGKTIGLWTYYEHSVTGVSSVTVSGSGDVDELRLYPQNAQMTTYTYNSLVGMSSQCDIDNRVTYFFYDPLGRLSYIKDQDGNVVKRYCYNYNGQSTSCQLLPNYPVVASNSTNQPLQLSFTNTTTNQAFTFTVSPGTTNQLVGNLPQATYNVTMTNPNPSSTYPIIYKYNNNPTQQYFALVSFGNQAVNSTVTVSASPPPYYAVTVSNGTNQNMTVSFTDVNSGGTWTYTVAPGANNQNMGSVPNSTYTISMTPVNPVSNYPIIYTFNSYTQTYYALVYFGNEPVTGPVSVTTTTPPYYPLVVTNSTSKSLQIVYTNSSTNVTYTFTAAAGLNNSTVGSVPVGTFGVSITPANPVNTYPILYTFDTYQQFYYALVGYSPITVSGTQTLSAIPAPNEPIDASNNTTQSVTMTFTNTSTNAQYYFTVEPGAVGGQVGTVPMGTYNVWMSNSAPLPSQPILWEIGTYSQTYYGAVGFDGVNVNNICTVNIIRQY